MSFVHSSYDSANTSRQILILCQNEERKQRLFMIELDPWKRIDRKVKFDQPETIIDFEGDVAKAPSSYSKPQKFTADKIRNAQIITRTFGESQDRITLVTLVIQYEDCIATAAVRSNTFIVQCNPDQMINEY